MREFNTSGPNHPKVHYTLARQDLIEKGIELVRKTKYFTIWAPRQTGKSTYFRLLAIQLEQAGYKVAHINFENYRAEPIAIFMSKLKHDLSQFWQIQFDVSTIGELFNQIETIADQKLVLIIDEVEGINEAYFGHFLHAIRSAYHSKERHGLKSVILVGVANITGVVQDHASPFNIVDNLAVPFFSNQETHELLAQHEQETGQLFADKVKAKIAEITANQPGLVNGFARKLVEDYTDKAVITYEDYLQVEDWYINVAIDKNVANIVAKAKQYRSFVEYLLFTEHKIDFKIDRPAIKVLFTNGLIKRDENGHVAFWVPLYQKKLFNTFYPYTNGEGKRISTTMLATAYLDENGRINFDKLIDKYKKHVQLRSFRPYREKDEHGKFKSIKEAAMIYSFETFISIFIQEIEGQSYREAFVSLGNTDLIINVKGVEYLIESKKYYSPRLFQKGKGQLAYYCNRKGISEGVYIVFIENFIDIAGIVEAKEEIEGVMIKTYLIRYDEETDFG
ncbi:MAG: AAA-like domain-containing protein [Bacteroidota bacterium]